MCGETIAGRTDKMFCCDSCRSEYHNRQRRKDIRHRRRVDRALAHNWSVLRKCLREGSRTISLRMLKLRMFNPAYYTECRKRFLRPTIYSCYNYEYYTSLKGIVHIRDTKNDYLCNKEMLDISMLDIDEET